MTVKELIDRLNTVPNKHLNIYIECEPNEKYCSLEDIRNGSAIVDGKLTRPSIILKQKKEKVDGK